MIASLLYLLQFSWCNGSPDMLEMRFAEGCGPSEKKVERQGFDVVRTASLTLLRFIVGIPFVALFVAGMKQDMLTSQ